MTPTLALDAEQGWAVGLPWDRAIAIVGAPGTGKTTALEARSERAAREHPQAQRWIVRSRAALAREAHAIVAAVRPNVRAIDSVEARALFARTSAPFMELEWGAFSNEAPLDPEVTGLRFPERFLDAAFRLVVKLRDATLAPETFLQRALKGAADFCTQPPNLVDPALFAATKAVYRDSLAVDGAELARQYRREVDLAKILARLYGAYLEGLEREAAMTDGDAIVAATAILADASAPPTTPTRFAFLDDAQELCAADVGFLQARFGTRLAGVTFAGDPSCAFESFGGGRADLAFGLATETVTLRTQYRLPAGIERAAAQAMLAAPTREYDGIETCVALHRAADESDEAAFIAANVAATIAAGTPPDRIAILFRSVANVDAYEAALLDRDIPTCVQGDVNLFRDRRALDALALLWNAYDPFAHAWMLRTLANPGVGLSDASLATLCSEPDDRSQPLFVLDGETPPTARAGRWDPRRDLRLGWNVVRGERDAALGDDARERIVNFRRAREGWIEALQTLSFEAFVRTVWRGLAREGRPASARARAQQHVLRWLLARLMRFHAETPDADLGTVLADAQRAIDSDLERTDATPVPGFVRIASVDATHGLEFEHVVVARARAGSFPRWYVPDAFLFSPRYGMIPKENVGDARSARTAKFTYYMHRAKTQQSYNARERRAFAFALARASRSLVVTASGAPTRGIAAPEFLEELRRARLPGSTIL